jgi:putative colanic acid biosynthesis acetyltransferase WcaF
MHNTDTFTGPSFSLSNRLKRLVWNAVHLIFFRYSPRPLHGYRSLVLRCFGAKIGKGVHVYPNVKIWAPWNISLADECGIANGAILYSQGFITIGRRTVISQGTHLCAGTHDYTLPGFPLITKPITIGSDVWIAAESFVHPGVQIGDGSVVGARSVVNRDLPANMICSGHPCIAIKPRTMQSEPPVNL